MGDAADDCREVLERWKDWEWEHLHNCCSPDCPFCEIEYEEEVINERNNTKV